MSLQSKRVNNSGWPALIGKHALQNGLVHLIVDAFGGSSEREAGWIQLACEMLEKGPHHRSLWTGADKARVVEQPLTCLACMAASQ